jgi:hypothetical protein
VGRADFENAKRLYPSVTMGEAEWYAYFQTPAGEQAIGYIMRDIYDEVLALEERESGRVPMGRRAARPAVPLSTVYAKVFPTPYSNEPFPAALRTLMNGRSIRAFAAKVPMAHVPLYRLLAGTDTPDLRLMELLAVAARIKPTYFLEYRAQFVALLVHKALVARPHLSIRAIHDLKVTA